MKLIIDEVKAQELIDSCALLPQDEKGYYGVKTIVPQSDLIIVIPVEIQFEKDVSPENVLKSTGLTRKSLKNYYEQFVANFPTSDMHGSFPRTRALRNDSRKQGFDRFKRLVEQFNYAPQDIIEACIYECTWRMDTSYRVNENLMKYMKSMTVWLYDEGHVGAQIEEMKKGEYTPSDNNIKLFDDI